MDRPELIKLISIAYTQDDIGQEVETETEREVFCSVSSLSRSEWVAASQQGLRPDIRVTVSAFDYNDETIVVRNAVRYAVYRSYVRDDDCIDLYLQRKAGTNE